MLMMGCQSFEIVWVTHSCWLVEQILKAFIPRTKGPALLALLPDIPGHCSLLALPDVSPAPLSDERRLDILELYGGTNLISSWDKDSQLKGKAHTRDCKNTNYKWYKTSVIYNQETIFIITDSV